MQAIVDELLITYTRAGKGPVVVLIHGWGDSSASFRGMENNLTKKFVIINVDLPGFGQSAAPQGVWGLDEYAQFVSDFLAKIGVEHVHAFLGHSNGAAVIIKGAGNGTLRSDKIVLLGAAGIRTGQPVKRSVVKVIAKAGKAATFFLPDHHKKVLRKKLYGVVGSDMLVAPELQETFKKTVRQDVQADATKIQSPTLLIYGRNDPATPVTDGERYKSLIPNAELLVVDDAGHYVHQEKSDQVLERIEAFL